MLDVASRTEGARDDGTDEPEDVAHPVLYFAQQQREPRLGLLALADVLRDAEQPGVAARGHSSRFGQPADAAIGHHHAPLHLQLPGLARVLERLLVTRAVIVMNAAFAQRRRYVGASQSPQLIDHRRPPDVAGDRTHFPHAHARELLRLGEATLAGTQGRLGADRARDLEE